MSDDNDILRRILRRAARVLHAKTLGFVELVGLGELDPGKAFRNATLRGDLSNQDLAGFDFTGTIFTSTCDLRGADFTRSVGVTWDQLKGAITDETTKPPFWSTGRAPKWAEDWGRDKHGPWVSFRMPGTDVTQRMRWCPKGDFMMGSGADDKAAYESEKPQHRVTFAEGFWMFDTACTEELWSAVTGAAPYQSRGPHFPVTYVSWQDAQKFAETLNELVPGLGLPSEAQWEYACRAGTTTPYSFGRRINKQQVRFGQRFEAGPVAVGSLPANPWGLFEMHGNVYEWCEDGCDDNYDATPSDGPRDRVIRGGFWFDNARHLREADRDVFAPSHRFIHIGLRLAIVLTVTGRSVSGDAISPAARIFLRDG